MNTLLAAPTEKLLGNAVPHTRQMAGSVTELPFIR